MTDKKITVAITGANGFLGSALVQECRDAGWNVIGLVRRPLDFTPTANLSYRAYDLLKPLSEDMLKGVDILIHCAYIKDSPGQDAFTANINAAKALLANSRANSVKKNIFISSMSSHGAALSVYGRQKFAIERLFNGKSDANIRPGLIIGDGGIVKQMATFMKKVHVVPLIGGGKQPLQVIHIDDLRAAIHLVIANNITGTLTVATPQVYSYKDFYVQLAESLRIKVFYIPVPYFALLYTFRLIEVLKLPVEIGKDSVLGLKALQAADNSGDMKRIGLAPKSLPQSLESTAL